MRNDYNEIDDGEQFFCVYNWMLDYKLPGTVRDVYALIYSLTQGEFECSYYSRGGMAKRLRLDISQVSKAIKFLLSVGLVREINDRSYGSAPSLVAVRLPLSDYLAAKYSRAARHQH